MQIVDKLRNIFHLLAIILCAVAFLFLYTFIVIALVIVRIFPLGKFGDKIIAKTMYWVSAFLTRYVFAFIGGYSIEVSGRENLVNGAIYTPNHISFIDSLFMLGVIPNSSIVMKGKYAQWFIIRILVKYYDLVSIGNGEREQMLSAFEKISFVLNRGRNLIIFPEGTRSVNGRVGEFKGLAFKVARTHKLPIVPVAIVANAPFLRKGEGLFRTGRNVKIKISILPSIASESVNSADTLAAYAYRAVRTECEKISSEFKKIGK